MAGNTPSNEDVVGLFFCLKPIDMSKLSVSPDTLNRTDQESLNAAAELEGDILSGLLKGEDNLEEEGDFEEEDDFEDDFEEEDPDEPEGSEEDESPKQEAPKPGDLSQYAQHFTDFLEEGEEVNTQEDYDRVVGRVVSKYKENETLLREELEANDVLVDIFEREPRFAQLARILSKNKDASLDTAIYSVLGFEQTPVPDKKTDPEGYAEYLVAKREHEREQKKAQEQIDSNIQQSEKVISDFQQSNRYTDDDINLIKTKAHEFTTAIGQGRISAEFLEVMAKGLKFDDAVQSAARKASVEGKNEAANRAKQSRRGDGLPKAKQASGGGRPKGKPAAGSGSMLDNAINAAINPFR